MAVTIDNEIDRTARFGQLLEDLVYSQAKEGRLVFRTENDDLLVSYWSMILDYCKGIGCLLHHKFHSPAFALQRPLVEALIRAHVVLVGSEVEVAKIRRDRYNVSYEKDGARIDRALGLGSLFEDFLKTSRNVLHSLTHSGTAQLQKRWEADWLGSGFDDEDISALLSTCSVAVFLITILITKHFGMDEQTNAAKAAWLELGVPTT
ncbi:MAG: hypothetical protein WAM13_12265 [Candidatus Sulfotelmatobacter sp.]